MPAAIQSFTQLQVFNGNSANYNNIVFRRGPLSSFVRAYIEFRHSWEAPCAASPSCPGWACAGTRCWTRWRGRRASSGRWHTASPRREPSSCSPGCGREHTNARGFTLSVTGQFCKWWCYQSTTFKFANFVNILVIILWLSTDSHTNTVECQNHLRWWWVFSSPSCPYPIPISFQPWVVGAAPAKEGAGSGSPAPPLPFWYQPLSDKQELLTGQCRWWGYVEFCRRACEPRRCSPSSHG